MSAQLTDAGELSALQSAVSSAAYRGLASSVSLATALTVSTDGVSRAAPLQICCYPLAADAATAAIAAAVAVAAAVPTAHSVGHVLCVFRQ
jgi:hypothetical protein